jgi:hypothetical protein
LRDLNAKLLCYLVFHLVQRRCSLRHY